MNQTIVNFPLPFEARDKPSQRWSEGNESIHI